MVNDEPIPTEPGSETVGRVLFAALGILVFTNGPSVFLAVRIVHTDLSFDGWPFTYPVTLIGVAAVGLLARSARRPAWRVQTGAQAVAAAYVLWCLVSVFWSVAPDATGFRSPALIGLTAFAIWFATALDHELQLRAICYCGLVVTLGSALLILFKPRWGGGYWDGERDIHYFGIFASANSLGPAAVLSFVSFVAASFLARTRHGMIAWSGAAAIALWLLIGTHSDTARVAFGLAVTAGIGLAILSYARRHGAPARHLATTTVGVIGIATVLVIPRFWSIVGAVSSDASLGGRREIWEAVRPFISERRWYGSGYWAFWDQPDIAILVPPTQNSAHNGFLEVALGLGVIGATLFIATCVLAIAGVTRLLWVRGFDALSCWWATVLTVLLAFNVTESFVLWNSYVWVLLVTASIVGWTSSVDQTVGLDSNVA